MCCPSVCRYASKSLCFSCGWHCCSFCWLKLLWLLTVDIIALLCMTVILQGVISGESGEEWSTLDCNTEYSHGRRGSFSVSFYKSGKLSRGTNLNDNSDCQRFGQRLWASSGQIAKKLVRVLSIDRHAQSVKNITNCFMLGLYSNAHIIKHIM